MTLAHPNVASIDSNALIASGQIIQVTYSPETESVGFSPAPRAGQFEFAKGTTTATLTFIAPPGYGLGYSIRSGAQYCTVQPLDASGLQFAFSFGDAANADLVGLFIHVVQDGQIVATSRDPEIGNTGSTGGPTG